MNPYEELANAIVAQACVDYRTALAKLKYAPHHAQALADKKEIEKFFLSPWFMLLTNLDGKRLMNTIRNEYVNRRTR